MVLNYSVCPCLFDIVFASNYNEINELIKFLSVNFLTILHGVSTYICCKDSIEFYFDYNKQSVNDKTCSTVSEPISCLDLICFGFEDVYLKCEKLILKYFLEHLSKIEK